MPALHSEPMSQLVAWLEGHGALLSWLAFISVAMLIATPVLLPAWVASLPASYFVAPSARPKGALQWAKRVAAWALGAVLIVAGFLMMFLPGQGLLTLFAGMSLVPFPGKRALMNRVLRQPKVAQGLQWMRRRAGRPELDLPS